MTKAILISGVGDSGKTGTCKSIRNRILLKGGVPLIEKLGHNFYGVHVKNKKFDSTSGDIAGYIAIKNTITIKEPWGDFRGIYELNGFLYVIVSSGDTKKSVEDGINMIKNWLRELNRIPDFIILTSRTKGTIKIFKSYDFAYRTVKEYDKNPTIMESIHDKNMNKTDIENKIKDFRDKVIKEAKLPLQYKG